MSSRVSGTFLVIDVEVLIKLHQRKHMTTKINILCKHTFKQNADLIEEDKKDSGKLSAGRGRSWSHPHPPRAHCASDIAKRTLGTRTLDNAEMSRGTEVDSSIARPSCT
jgi:hypothetical protein